MEAEKKRGGARLGGGRKPLAAGVVTVPVTIKLTPVQKEKLLRLGGAPWIRDRIERAKEKSED